MEKLNSEKNTQQFFYITDALALKALCIEYQDVENDCMIEDIKTHPVEPEFEKNEMGVPSLTPGSDNKYRMDKS